MSLTSTRDEFVAALAAVAGLTPTTSAPRTPRAGSCWPDLSLLEATGVPGLMQASWRVLLVCGGTPADSLAYMDEHLQDVVDAIGPVAFVQSVTPVALANLNAGELFGIEIRTVRE